MDDVAANIPPRNYNGLALADRLGTFAAQQGEKLRSKKKSGSQNETVLPVTIIPAQPRGQTWSPDIIRQQQEEAQQEEATQATGVPAASEQDRVNSPTTSHGVTVRPSAPSTPLPQDESTSTIDFSRPGQHSRTDHDR